jgi:hypothetical protein
MLIQMRDYLREKGASADELALYGQEAKGNVWSICNMNMLLHGIADAEIRQGDTIRELQHLDECNEPKRFDRVFQNQNHRCRFEPEHVVFARKGKVGLARRYGPEKKVFGHTVALTKNRGDRASAVWLLRLARSGWFIGGIDIAMNTNSGVPTLGVEFIESIQVSFPLNEEQRLIADRLGSTSKQMDAEIERRNKLINQKWGLMQDLLTGKVQVNPDPSEPGHA